MNNNKQMRRFSIYIDDMLVREIQTLAERERRSVSSYISYVLDKAVSKKRATFIEKCKEK